MTALLDLAARCEAATGPDRAIDFDIAEFVTRAHMATGKAPTYTASLDAAMTLVPEGEDWEISAGPNDATAQVLPYMGKGEAVTPALALCAAALRARAS